MEPLRVGLVADPAYPTQVARRLDDLQPADREGGPAWDVELLSEPFTSASESPEDALDRLADLAGERRWEVVVGVTELPLRDDDGHYLLAEADRRRGVGVLSLPALGGVRPQARARTALLDLITDLTDPDPSAEARVPLPPRGGRARLLRGMVIANRPWRLVPGLSSALVAALTTGAIATINSTVWLLADSLHPWRLVVATVAAIALVVGWLIIDAHLWDRPEDDSREARERSRLYNTSTVLTLTAGAVVCYVVLYLVNLVWAFFVLDPAVMGGFLRISISHADFFLLAWFVASAATVGGALGSGLESEEAVRAAAYSKREELRRERLAERD
ncbi:hypothetical protein QE364_001219 [Nocardioides zeae]|uniref:Uncharacterized protein n=1 Tax=Nocardioides zeae TaxID=1457234 RepID=A0ACC6IFR8_9ACTN|nr:hypothetical protein [Nocardioides zeae]MDR6176507.1 hypothetical protein [Nocardioides zeae]MDR6209519.1 hypothetical protein [Nocardioides zeae]